MKETTKVSIGGFAFNIDTDAYELLDSYLTSLKNHFQNRPEGDEIIADVEARMSELFHLKLASSDKIATLKDAEEIISTMGNPRDFDEEGEEIPTENRKAKEPEAEKLSSRFKNKKIYRDVDQKVVAGVCSGLGHFFRFDPVLIRIGFILLLFLTNFVSHKFNLISVAIYVILWIAMPKAKTMTQKIAMFGQDPTIEGIENRDDSKVKRMRGENFSNSFLTVVRVFIGVLLTLQGVVFLSCAIFVIYSLYFGHDLSITHILPHFGVNLKESGFAFALCGFLPGFMFLYAGIRLFYRMQKRDIVVLCVSFVIWLSSSLYVANIVQKEVREYQKEITVTENTTVLIPSDTLIVKLDPALGEFTDLFNGLNWYQKDNGNEWFVAPSVVVLADTITRSEFQVSIEKKAYSRTASRARRNAEESKLDFKIEGTSMIIYPSIYTVAQQWNRKFFKIIIKAPRGKYVKVDYPITSYYTQDEVDLSELGNPSVEKTFSISIE